MDMRLRSAQSGSMRSEGAQSEGTQSRNPSARVGLLLGMLLAVTLLPGCTSALRGGPKDALDASVSIDSTGQAAADLNEAKDTDSRNRVIDTRMMMLDRSYADYVAAINRERTRGKLGSQLGELLLSIGGTVTGSPAERKTFAAASSLIKGSDAIVDRTVFFEQTIIALVTAMDANRAKIRLRIQRSMPRGLDEYSRSQAYQDLEEYAGAGTLLGALRYVQASAEEDKKATDIQIDNTIRRLPLKLPPSQRAVRVCATAALNQANPNRSADKMKDAAAQLGLTLSEADTKTDRALALALQKPVREASDEASYRRVDEAFRNAGLYPADSECR